jgi:O-antigen ligase
MLLGITPLVVLPEGKESFRLVQGLVSGWLGIASLAIASWALRDAGSLHLRDGRRQRRGDAAVAIATPIEKPPTPRDAGSQSALAVIWQRYLAIRALVPLVVIVAIGGLFTAHSTHFHAAFADFLIGVACVIGWSLALREETLHRLLIWSIVPAVIVALLGLDQFAGWFGTLDWLHIQAPTARLRLTSTIGNPGDLASLLVLPTILAISRWPGATTRVRLVLAASVVVMLATIAVTATLVAAIAVTVGVALWWTLSSPLRSRLRAIGVLTLALVLLGGGTLALLTPLRTRVVEKAGELARGDINALLTGRLDGWRTALAMLRRVPLTGVGQGAFRAEFADTRLALEAQGVSFYPEQQQVILATPHNEALSVGAEQGVPGLIALGWAVWTLCVAATRLRDPAHRALVWSGLGALGVLCVASFPLHVASVAWPWLLFLAWTFRQATPVYAAESEPLPPRRAEAGAADRARVAPRAVAGAEAGSAVGAGTAAGAGGIA